MLQNYLSPALTGLQCAAAATTTKRFQQVSTPAGYRPSLVTLPLYRFTHLASFNTIQFSSTSCFVALEEERQCSGIANTGLIEIVDGQITKQTTGMGKIQAD